MGRIVFQNSTTLRSDKLLALVQREANEWAVGTINVKVRYSRGADYSGSCFYADARIYINLGRHLKYPYRMGTHLARAVSVGRRWYKPVYTVELSDGYQVVLFIFLHELYHLLVKRAGRNTRQKESMCDRFAARRLVDDYGAIVRSCRREIPVRRSWDFQDLDRFVAKARDRRVKPARPTPPQGADGEHDDLWAPMIRGPQISFSPSVSPAPCRQLLLFGD